MSIPQSFVQELLARADVVEIVGRSVQLKKGGANFTGLCPFHSEKSPSFSVSPSKQFYHCFGCGKNGNAISFLMDFAGMGFVEAVKDLAQEYGLQVPEDERSPQERMKATEARERQTSLTDVLERAAAAYKKQLKISPRAIDYLKHRGLSGDIAKTFGLGYVPEGWRALASVFPDYSDPLLEESGLVIVNTEGSDEKRYDRFRDRVMFPIRNVKGECIGFGGRVLGDEKPKYLNSPETPVFSKGRELYGLFEARNALRDAGYVLVTEGYMDVVALAQLGFPNAVATLGTACTKDHVQKLFRFTDSVVFSFDGDAAGRRAARKALDAALPYATDTRSVKFLFLPVEHDPDSYIRANGQEAFAQMVSNAVPLSRFLLDTARESCDLSSAEGRSHLAANAKPLWAAMPEGALKQQLLNDIADLVQLSPRELLDAWKLTPTAPTNSGQGLQRPSSIAKKPVAFQDERARSQPIQCPVQPGCALLAVLITRRACCCPTWAPGTTCRVKTTTCFANKRNLMVPCLPGLITNCMSTVLKPGGLRAKGFGIIPLKRWRSSS
jgi:DNA primase